MAYPDRPENGIKAPPVPPAVSAPPKPPRDGYITAYQIARKHGFTGTEEEWLASLVGGSGGSSGADGVSPTVSVEVIDGGYRVTITDVNGEASFDLLNGTDGKDGTDGVGIERIERTSGDGSPGTTDIYTITLTDGAAETFSVYNGADGEGGTGGGADLLEEVETDVLAQQTLTFAYDGALYSSSLTGGLGLADGETYIVEWGDETDTLTAQRISETLNACSLGNLALGELGDDTGEDILIVTYGDQSTILVTTREGTEQTVRIYRMAETLKEEYLPTDAIRMIVDEVIEEALGGEY